MWSTYTGTFFSKYKVSSLYPWLCILISTSHGLKTEFQSTLWDLRAERVGVGVVLDPMPHDQKLFPDFELFGGWHH